MRARVVSGVALAALLTGCAGPSDERSSSGANDEGLSSASCVLRVVIDGREWTGWSLKEPLERPTVDAAVQGVLPGCDDMGGDVESATSGEEVTLKPIKGIAPEQALFLPDHDLDDQIFVPGMDVSFDSLSPQVQELIQNS